MNVKPAPLNQVLEEVRTRLKSGGRARAASRR